jgi:hypothetical protein
VGAVALLDSGRPLRYGVPQSITTGLYIGLEEGIVWTLWNNAQGSDMRISDGKVLATMVWGLSTVGAIGGGLLGSALSATPGRASWVHSSAIWTGAIAGLLVGAATGDQPFNTIDFSQPDLRGRNAYFAAGIGLNAGALGGMLTAGSVSPSVSRVRFLDLGALAGGVVLGGLYVAAADQSSNLQAGLGMTALGIAGGLSIAWILTNGMDKDDPEAGRTPSPTAAGRPMFSWHPTILPAPSGMQVGIVGGM